MTVPIETLWGLEPGRETEALCWHTRQHVGTAPWDGRNPGEPSAEVRDRHEQARRKCHRCPLLTACERALSDMEKDVLRVDGVMAGRYSDVKPYNHTDLEFTQSTCRGCQHPLLPRGTVSQNRKHPDGARRHIGEGLCEDCYPRLARAVRNPTQPPPKRSYQLNNPTGTVR